MGAVWQTPLPFLPSILWRMPLLRTPYLGLPSVRRIRDRRLAETLVRVAHVSADLSRVLWFLAVTVRVTLMSGAECLKPLANQWRKR